MKNEKFFCLLDRQVEKIIKNLRSAFEPGHTVCEAKIYTLGYEGT